MDKREFVLFSNQIKAAYPRENLLPTVESAEIWYRMLQDVSYNMAEVFLQKWLTTQKWSPSIAEIRSGCSGIERGDIPDWGSAWEEAIDAVRRFGYMEERRALDSMRLLTRETVRRLGWSTLCESENREADRSNFRQIYQQLEQKHREIRQMPNSLTAQIEALRISDEYNSAKQIADVPKPMLASGEATTQRSKEDVLRLINSIGKSKEERGEYKPLTDNDFEKKRQEMLMRLKNRGGQV